MDRPQEGDLAPDFTLPTDGGGSFCLSGQRGQPLVLFFYPRDDTAGCTAEAIAFTAARPEFDRLQTRLAGMSPDPVRKHDRFRDKHGLGVTLISDENTQTLARYGVWVEKSLYGRKYMGVERSTFLIDRDGRIVRAWRKISVPGHVDEVLAAARERVG